MAISAPALTVPKDPPVPGPGQYNIGNCDPPSKNPMPSAAFASRTDRIGQNSQANINPGPGNSKKTIINMLFT